MSTCPIAEPGCSCASLKAEIEELRKMVLANTARITPPSSPPLNPPPPSPSPPTPPLPPVLPPPLPPVFPSFRWYKVAFVSSSHHSPRIAGMRWHRSDGSLIQHSMTGNAGMGAFNAAWNAPENCADKGGILEWNGAWDGHWRNLEFDLGADYPVMSVGFSVSCGTPSYSSCARGGKWKLLGQTSPYESGPDKWTPIMAIPFDATACYAAENTWGLPCGTPSTDSETGLPLATSITIVNERSRDCA